MFALHETTQRRVCRVTFLTLCVVPTLLTLVGIAYCNRPWRQADWQRTLSQNFHVRATLDDISRPQPGVTKLTNLQLADLRTNRPLGSLEKLSFHRQNSRLTLHADHLVIEAEQLPALATAIATWLATGELEPLDFRAEQLTINGPSLRTVQLKNLSITSVATNSQGLPIQLKAFNEAGETIQLTLENQGSTLRCLVDAQQGPLPAWLVGQFVPGMSGCGDASFLGKISTTSENQHLKGKLKGLFNNVDLQTWIGNDGPHRLQGTAQLQLEQLKWTDNGIELAQGMIEAHRGAASYSLLLEMRQLFLCLPGVGWETLKPATTDEMVPFEQLSLRFHMTEAGIAIAGESNKNELLLGHKNPLLYGPQGNTPVAIAQLVRLFHNPQQGWLPDTRRAIDMARELPLPKKVQK